MHSGLEAKLTPGMSNRVHSAGMLLFGLLFLAGLSAPFADAAPATLDAVSSDGKIVFFATDGALVNGDTDNQADVYKRSQDEALGGEYVTRLVSTGSIGGNQALPATFAAASDGLKVLFETRERLVSADGDKFVDLYLRDSNTTQLVSLGDEDCIGTCGNGDYKITNPRITGNGSRAFFRTAEPLSDADIDTSEDIYMRDLSVVGEVVTELVSQADTGCGSCSDEGLPALEPRIAAGGMRVFFTSDEKLDGGDADGQVRDIYMRDLTAQTTQLVSAEGDCPEGKLPAECLPVFEGISPNGGHAFFQTLEQHGEDIDDFADLYDWSDGGLARASIGADGTGNGPHHATYVGTSTDGASVFFRTTEKLTSTDEDSAIGDIYERRDSLATELVSTGPQSVGSSPPTKAEIVGQGTNLAVLFVTAESLVTSDLDGSQDVYIRSDAETTLVSRGSASCEPVCGNGDPFNADIADASDDGTHVVFVTSEKLASADKDSARDAYERFAGNTRLISVGPNGGNSTTPVNQVVLAADGSKSFFETVERLTSDDDFLEQSDVYGNQIEIGTLLESKGNNPDLEIGPPAPTLLGTNPDSPNPSTVPKLFGQAATGTEIKLYTNANCTGEQAFDPSGEPAGGTWSELGDPGIAVSVSAGQTVTFYATAEADGLVSLCSKGRTYAQQSEQLPQPPPGPGEGTGGADGAATGGGSAPSGGSSGPTKTHSGGIPFVMPETRITFGPSFKTRKREVAFRFFDATGQPGTSFICRLDRRTWRGCGSPMRLRKLTLGEHAFSVKAKNAVGDWEPRPTKRRFKVVRG